MPKEHVTVGEVQSETTASLTISATYQSVIWVPHTLLQYFS